MNTPFGRIGAICAVAAAAFAATPSWSQQGNDPMAYSIAVRQDACDGRKVEKAYFVESRRIAVECEGDNVAAVLPGGAGQVGALGAVGIMLLGAFAAGSKDGGGGSAGSTGATGSTTGTQ